MCPPYPRPMTATEILSKAIEDGFTYLTVPPPPDIDHLDYLGV